MRHLSPFPTTRLRRLRQNTALRDLIRETRLELEKFVMPLFVRHGHGIKNPIPAMPGMFQLSLDQLDAEIRDLYALGIKSVLLFGIPAHKDPLSLSSYAEDGIIQQAIPIIKAAAPAMLVMSDICCCEYSDHGHCGIITAGDHERDVIVDNDQTLAILARQALSHARAGTDIIAPSATMDGMVFAIREALDHAGYQHLPILSYSVKYASAMYGPFRQAAEGAPKFGDRRTYQMDYANTNEAMRECMLDIAEGADMIMVKPAHTYLDVIYRIKESFPELPLCAYHTSGEYAMIKAAAQNGWIDERKTAIEVLTAIRRAGADVIISYYTKALATWLANQ